MIDRPGPAALRLSRRQLLGAAALGVGGLVVAGCSSSGDSGSPTDLHGGTAGRGLVEPEVVESSGGVLRTSLVARARQLPWGSGTRYSLAYSGSSPGPTLKARPGDLLAIELVNELDQATNLHTHGLHVSPEGSSDNVSRMAMPGERLRYEIQLPEDQAPGTYWYHPHAHELVASQVSGGLAGAIVVEGEADTGVLAGTTERTLVLTNPKVGSGADVLSASHAEKQAGREGDVLLVNGGLQPRLVARQGDVERWRIVNATPSLYLKIECSSLPMSVIAWDQGLLPAPVGASQVLLAPGQRAEVLVPVLRSGRATVTATSMSRGHMSHGGSGDMGGMGGMDMGNMGRGSSASAAGPSVTLLSLDATASSTKASLPSSLPGRSFAATRPTVRSRTVTLGAMAMGDAEFVIDGEHFDPKRIDIAAAFGTAEEWVLVNTSMMDHPFHLHTWPFLVTARSDGPADEGWRDTVWVPAGEKVTIYVPFTGVKGRTVYHCHVLDHEDLGMMGQISVA